MFSTVHKKIDVNIDSLQHALSKKADNADLSNKSLSKIEKIVNSQYGIKCDGTQFIFGKKRIFSEVEPAKVSRFIKELTVIRKETNNPRLREKMDTWIDRAQVMLKFAPQVKSETQNVAAAKEPEVHIYKEDRAENIGRPSTINHTPNKPNAASAQHAVDMCRAYHDVKLDENNNWLEIPHIAGMAVGTKADTHLGVRLMFKKGFFMANAKPINFSRVSKKEVAPIDFRLVFTLDSLANIDKKIQKNMLLAYIREGFSHVPPELQSAYRIAFAQIDRNLQNESPLRNANTVLLERAHLQHI